MTKALPALPSTLRGRATRPGDRDYPLLRSTYTTVAAPALVLRPRTEAEVSAALRYAAETDVSVSVRSGGHGLSGRSSNDGGIVVDLSALAAVEVVDRATGLVRIGPGARWAQVAAELAPSGLAISSGDHGNVGVGGLATAGGVGWLTRAHGLTIDSVRAARVVLPDGTVTRTDSEHEPDLFWAVRGAGDGVGAVTEFEIAAKPLGRLGTAQVVIEADRSGAALRRWSEHMAQAPREVTTNAVLFSDSGRSLLQMTAVVASEDPDRVRALLEPLSRLGRTLDLSARMGPYTALVPQGHLHPNVGQQPSHSTNGLFPTLTADSARAIMDVATHPYGPLVQLRSMGGAVNDVAPEETAYVHRHQQVLAIFSSFPPAGPEELGAAVKKVRRFADGAYRNFDSVPDRAAFRRAYPGSVGDRVLELRRRYDPGGLLRRVDDV